MLYAGLDQLLDMRAEGKEASSHAAIRPMGIMRPVDRYYAEIGMFWAHVERNGAAMCSYSFDMESGRTEDPLFRGNRPVMEFSRTQDPLLHQTHGLIPKNLTIEDLLSAYCCEMGKTRE